MHHFIPSFIAAAVAVFAASKLFKGVRVKSNGTLALVALVFGLLTVFIGWLVKIVVAIALFPAALLTFGLIYLLLDFFVYCVLLWLTDKFIDDFEIKNGRTLLATAGLISVAVWVLQRV